MRLLSTLTFSLLLLSAASTATAASQREEWNRPFQPIPVIGNIYYVGAAGVSAFLIVTPQGNILIDGGLPETAPLIEKNIAALGFKIKDVKYLLNSHAHYDHCGGLAELKKASGAQLVVSRPDAPVIEAGRDVFGTFPPVKVDRRIDDGATISLGGSTLTAHITPGHTRGCTNWTMPVTDHGQTHQAIFFCSTSVPGYKLVHNTDEPNIVEEYRSSFAALRKLNADVFLGAHGEFFKLEEKAARVKPGQPNPFVDPAEFHTYLEQSSQQFEENLKKQQQQ